MADFWNSLLTEKSWNQLIKLSKEPFKFILIGGWAAYLWTKLHKSKDIDIALYDIKELDYLKNKYALKKNDRLKKYEIQFDEIDLDIYVPYYSKLSIPIENLKDYSAKIEGFNVVKPEALLVLKQGAEIERGASVKGIQDQIDIMAILCYAEINYTEYMRLLKKYKKDNYLNRLKSIVQSFKDYNYLNLNPRSLKLKKEELLSQLK